MATESRGTVVAHAIGTVVVIIGIGPTHATGDWRVVTRVVERRRCLCGDGRDGGPWLTAVAASGMIVL